MAEHHYKFHIKMTCSGCSGAIERVLGRMEGILPLLFPRPRQGVSPLPSFPRQGVFPCSLSLPPPRGNIQTGGRKFKHSQNKTKH